MKKKMTATYLADYPQVFRAKNNAPPVKLVKDLVFDVDERAAEAIRTAINRAICDGRSPLFSLEGYKPDAKALRNPPKAEKTKRAIEMTPEELVVARGETKTTKTGDKPATK